MNGSTSLTLQEPQSVPLILYDAVAEWRSSFSHRLIQYHGPIGYISCLPQWDFTTPVRLGDVLHADVVAYLPLKQMRIWYDTDVYFFGSTYYSYRSYTIFVCCKFILCYFFIKGALLYHHFWVWLAITSLLEMWLNLSVWHSDITDVWWIDKPTSWHRGRLVYCIPTTFVSCNASYA